MEPRDSRGDARLLGALRVTPGGAPGAHFRTVSQLVVPSAGPQDVSVVTLLSMLLTASHDPRVAAVCGLEASLSISDEWNTPATREANGAVVLQQGDTLYWTGQVATNNVGWATFRWTAADFTRFVGEGPEAPDLIAGAPLSFGFTSRSSTSRGSTGTYTNTYAYDNFEVVLDVMSSPAPGAPAP